MIDILFIDDNPDEADLISRAIDRLTRPATYLILTGGNEGVDYLLQQGDHQGASTPRVVFIDLIMPDLSGLEVIKRVRANSCTRYLPLIAYSLSANPTDMRKAYDVGANAYLIKSGSYSETSNMLQKAIDFWLMD